MLHQLSLLFLGTLQVFSDLIIYKRNIKPPPPALASHVPGHLRH